MITWTLWFRVKREEAFTGECTQGCWFRLLCLFLKQRQLGQARLHLELELRKNISPVLRLFSDNRIMLDFHLSITHLFIFTLFLPFIIQFDPNKGCQVQLLCWPRANSNEPGDPA